MRKRGTVVQVRQLEEEIFRCVEVVFVLQYIPSVVWHVGMLNAFSEFVVLCSLSYLKMGLQKEKLKLNLSVFRTYKRLLEHETTKKGFWDVSSAENAFLCMFWM